MPSSSKSPSYGFEIHATKDASLDYTFYINPPKIRVISFKGGGSRVFVYQRFLEMISEYGVLDHVEELGGSSSGSYAAIFAAVHFEDPLKRTEALLEVGKAYLFDIMGDSPAWMAYKILTAPLDFVSQPIALLGEGINWIASQFNKTSLGKIIGYPLGIVGSALSAVGTIFSSRGIAGFFNLLTKGGFYRGKKTQECMRNRLQQDTQVGLDAILRKIDHPEPYMQRLIDVGLCMKEGDQLKVIPDITFKHLDELSKLPGSQFKNCYMTAMRVKDKKLVVFNKTNTPDMPIHLAARLAITFPLFFHTKKYQGDEYIDGGIINNAPVDLAEDKKVSAFKRAHGMTDKMARLNVRVEYADEFEFHLWKKPSVISRAAKFFSSVKRAIFKVITRGKDSMEADDQVTQTMQNDFAHRTLQLQDFDIDRMRTDTSEKKRKECLDRAGSLTEDYFKNHCGEKVVVKHYHSSADNGSTMPDDIRLKLLKYLQNDTIKTIDIYHIPGKSFEELEEMRAGEILRLQLNSTGRLFKKMDVTSALSHDEVGVSRFDHQVASDCTELEERIVTERTPLLRKKLG